MDSAKLRRPEQVQIQVESETGRFLSVDDGFCSLTGYSEAELLAKTAGGLFRPPEPLAPGAQERELVANDGRAVRVSVATTQLRDSSGRLISVAAIRDITPPDDAAAQLADATRFLEGVLEVSPQGIISVDSSGKILQANLSAERLFGHSRGELGGQNIEMLVPQCFRQGDEGSELTGQRKDGSEFPVEVTLSHISTRHGPIAVVFVTDITDRKRRMDALRLSALAMEASATGSWTWDARTRQSQWDERFRAMYGFGPHEPASFEAWIARVHPADRQRLLDRIDTVRRTPGDDRWDVEFRAVLPDGSTRWMHGMGRAERNPDGEVLRYAGINLDITEKETSREALKESEERLRAILERAGIGFAMFDRDMRYLLVNQQWMKDCGLSENPIGRSHYEVFPHIPERWKEVHRRGLAGEHVQCEEDQYRRADGPRLWVRWDVLPWYNAAGETAGIFILEEDITERRAWQDALLVSEERLRLATETTGVGTYEHELENQRSICSPQVYRIFGIPEAAYMESSTLISAIHPEDRAGFQELMMAALSGTSGVPIEGVYRIVRPDGTIRWIRDVATVLRTGEGEAAQATRLVGTAIDITDRVELRQKLEAALRNTDAELAALVESSPLAIIKVDAAGGVTSWNPAAERIFGYRASEVVGQVARGEGFPGRIADLGMMLSAGRSHHRGTRKDGTAIDIERWVAPLKDAEGRPMGAVILAEDVSESVRSEAELRRVRSALATAQEDEARRIARELHDDITQRLALLSVDMTRTIQALGAGETAEKMQHYRERIAAAVEGIRRVSHRLHPSILDDLGLRDAIEHLCGEVAEAHDVPVCFEAAAVPDRVPPAIASCLYRIAQEALRNAVKHAGTSEVVVRLEARDGWLALSVSDSGMGFDVSSAKLGLGLHSIRERVSLVNGTVSVESKPGAGTSIVVAAPLEPVH